MLESYHQGQQVLAKKRAGLSQQFLDYKMDISKLLHSPPEEDYKVVAEGVKAVWCEAFLEYFEINFDLDINQNAGRWNLEKIYLNDPYSGITKNASEALNSKLKRLLEWNEKTGDMAILYLYYWQINAVQDIMSGF